MLAFSRGNSMKMAVSAMCPMELAHLINGRCLIGTLFFNKLLKTENKYTRFAKHWHLAQFDMYLWRCRTSCVRTRFGFPWPLGEGRRKHMSGSYVVPRSSPVPGLTLACNLAPLGFAPSPSVISPADWLEAGGLTTGLANQRWAGDIMSPAAETLLDRTSMSLDTFWGTGTRCTS